MSLQPDSTPIGIEEYLNNERDSPVRHEYVQGHIYAMAGASDRHNRIALNVASRLDNALRDGPCEVFISDMKVRVDQAIFYYPDVMVSCDPPGADAYYRTKPVLLVEVASPSTYRTDHHEEKLEAYGRITSLIEYVLISRDLVSVEVYRREGESWVNETLDDPNESVVLQSVGLEFRLREIYRNVRFDEGS